jgi:hypothetical protein
VHGVDLPAAGQPVADALGRPLLEAGELVLPLPVGEDLGVGHAGGPCGDGGGDEENGEDTRRDHEASPWLVALGLLGEMPRAPTITLAI